MRMCGIWGFCLATQWRRRPWKRSISAKFRSKNYLLIQNAPNVSWSCWQDPHKNFNMTSVFSFDFVTKLESHMPNDDCLGSGSTWSDLHVEKGALWRTSVLAIG
jgi:hypothetical protein